MHGFAMFAEIRMLPDQFFFCLGKQSMIPIVTRHSSIVNLLFPINYFSLSILKTG